MKLLPGAASFAWLFLSAAAATPQTAPAGAQNPVGTVAAAGSGRSLTVAWEARRDRHTYRFENPSRFDTTQLVPHFYQQDYDQDNQWLVMTGRYRGLGRWWTTEAGLAWWGEGVGHDYDTFFQPGGDTVVYGTSANTALASIRLRQFVELDEAAGFRLRVGYGYRRDRAVFAASDSITRHSSPASETRFYNTGRESTVSEVHEVQFGVTRSVALTPAWRAVLTLDATPVTLARLTTKLPDKSPDKDAVGIAKGFSVLPALALDMTRGRLQMRVRLDYAHTWPYGRVNRFTRNWVGVTVAVGVAGR